MQHAPCAQHNGHERDRRPTPSGDLGNGNVSSAGNYIVPCGMGCLLIEREMVRAVARVDEHDPKIPIGHVKDPVSRLGRL